MVKLNNISKKCASVLLTTLMLVQASPYANAQIHYVNIEGEEQIYYGEDDKFDELTEQEQQYLISFIEKLLRHENDFTLTNNREQDIKIVKHAQGTIYYRTLVYMSLMNDDDKIHIVYQYENEDQNRQQLNNTYNYMDSILNQIITDDMNDFDKILAIYNYITDNYKYNYNYEKDFTLEVTPGKLKTTYQTINEITDKNEGVCHTFTYMLCYALKKNGINCYPVCGYFNTTDYHMWCCVEVNGTYYHLDPTLEITRRKKHGKGFRAFLQTDKERINNKVSKFEDYVLDNIECTDNTFEFFRKVTDATYLGDNVWKLKFGKKVKYLNSNTFEITNDYDKQSKI